MERREFAIRSNLPFGRSLATRFRAHLCCSFSSTIKTAVFDANADGKAFVGKVTIVSGGVANPKGAETDDGTSRPSALACRSSLLSSTDRVEQLFLLVVRSQALPSRWDRLQGTRRSVPGPAVVVGR